MQDDRTAFYKIPKPYVKNEMADDCGRLREALDIIDDLLNKVDSVAQAAKTAAEGAKSMADAAKTAAEGAKSMADSAKSEASSAKSTAETATSTANSAKSTADAASSTASAAKSTADTAKNTADAAKNSASSAASAASAAKSEASAAKTSAASAIAKTGARGELAGNETSRSLANSQTININSPDCVNLATSGAVTLTFTAAAATVRALKVICLSASAATTLAISGAVWANNGSAPAWGAAGKRLILLAHFVAGIVVLTVCDNNQ